MDINKLKKLSLKSLIKGTNSSRLQSLRLPRDLSLGETKVPPKKVYKPNVHAVRNKNKVQKSKNNEKSKFANTRKQEKNKERFVQSAGVFSEGIGATLNPQKKPEIKNMLKESQFSKNPNYADFMKASIHDNHSHIKRKVQSDLKTEESDSEPDEKVPFAPFDWDKNIKLSGTKTEIDYLNQLPPDYRNETDQTSLALWQLPDSFAKKGKKSLDFQLSDTPEGQIGKITVHKSGKYEVTIANTKLVLDPSLEAFYEEVVCLNPDTQNCYVLGELKNRFILSPEWGILL